MKARVHVFMAGRVQGVCFRDFVWRRAASLGLTGWVRNIWDRRVEVVAEGDKENLERFVGHLRTGPSMARVEDLEVSWEQPLGEFSDFRIARSLY